MRDHACDQCTNYVTANWYALRGACASVGIEHGRSTDAMLVDYVARYHERHA